MSVSTFVIAGGGLAGARAAESLRAEGFDGRLVLVAGEDAFPYLRPPLSKAYLAGTVDRASIDVHPPAWYADQKIEVLLGQPATGLALDTHRLGLADGRTLHYDKLLLATGASPRRFAGPGAGLAGVHHLRTVTESERLRAELEGGGRRVVVAGAGWIGLEVAAAARGFGNAVTVLARGSIPLGSVFGDQVGAVFAGLLLAGGEEVPADVVVVGIGALPDDGLARTAGLHVDDGIVVDAAFRTIDPDVYAVGDVASVFHPVLGHHLRVEHWANAEYAGTAAGRSMLDQAVSYDAIPYFYTDQFDLGMEYSGYGRLARKADVVFRGDRDGRAFIAFWLADGRVVAGMNVNVPDVNETVQAIIRSELRFDPHLLGNESIALEGILAAAADQGN
ncbi:3-phenylpropionate/trans-cinnamate dioxygenase ferredoxin reductase subunit [Cryobacterium sp. MP_M5]|uniref:NAD(P)/FAD-dependent oxidoreductase n=1 Tax=unclassified Cryobacterium TaxID=2649013 RepID=UPI0018CAF1A0|nr:MULTISPECIES: FAD-dependent oxidoreductase [unclassified Cryobacterium]MBG6057194.1 3-phenylpropionate/trans-cinnamate dioxygenase ferredoxin reductase subunit [Cryobacterium sp. MP_M3]MEC5175393.1 3-phenylpropionate/trans-cinnamate dioxygenase ferredoxin reductase subunit [Cryobacterium sp. MP_M5]